jgi:hypothetical protein
VFAVLVDDGAKVAFGDWEATVAIVRVVEV